MTLIIVALCLFGYIFDSVNPLSTITNVDSSVMAIDRNIPYGLIMPFIDEWTEFWKDMNPPPLSPFQFWFRCLGNEVRGYFFIEDLNKHVHGKEATLRNWEYLNKHMKITVDGVPVKRSRFWNGGGDFFFDLPANLSNHANVDVQLVGFKHFTRFQTSSCVAKPVISQERKYVMHIHLRDFTIKDKYQPTIIEGIAYHMAYHKCALKLDKYEIVIQEEHLQYYLLNDKIKHAVTQGWITFLLRNPVHPSPLNQKNSPSNCYYQAYAQNMALLQHWQENVKLYFFDSDEFLWVAPDLTGSDILKLVNKHSAVGFKRKMIFCDACDQPSKKLKKTLLIKPKPMPVSLTKSPLLLNTHVLQHPKLVVDPNLVGCYIVHWAGCGDVTVELPLDKVFIVHFENLYQKRWANDKRLRVGNESVYVAPPVQQMCDPVNYDWKSPLPSFHL